MATNRLTDGFYPATLKQYSRMWKDFCLFPGSSWVVVITGDSVLPAYLDFLANGHMSESNISHNVAALLAFQIIYGLPTDPFGDQRIMLILKSVKLARPFKSKITLSLTFDTLQKVITVSKTLDHPFTFVALYAVLFLFAPFKFIAR